MTTLVKIKINLPGASLKDFILFSTTTNARRPQLNVTAKGILKYRSAIYSNRNTDADNKQ
jgi:hypothetical protein